MGRIWLLFVIVVLQMLQSSLCNVHDAKQLESFGFIRCKKNELDALLKFKQSFTSYPKKLLSSWVGHDCCQWLGVTCDNVTHNVVKLNLRTHNVVKLNLRTYPQHFHADFADDDSGCLPNRQVSMVSSVISSALLKLEFLTHLDLSGNDFSGSHIPKFIGSLTRLRYLNLSSAGFSGPIPSQFGNLTNLVHLDLHFQCSYNSQSVYADGLGWAYELSKLQSLDLSGYSLSGAHDTFRVLGRLPSLSVLSLSNCELFNTSDLSKAWISNISNTFFPTLHHLDLGFNGFEDPLPSILESMVSLRSLNLGGNFFYSLVPLWLATMPQLEVLDLSSCDISDVQGGIMGIIGKPCRLKHLDLSNNLIDQGDILEPSMSSISFSGCDTSELQYLDLHQNYMKFSLPSSFGRLTNLKYLDLSSNEFKGRVPASFVNLTNLKYLDLSRNKLGGLIPDFTRHLTQIEHLDISLNSLQGQVPASFVKCLALKYLDLSRNNLTGLIPDFIGHLSQIEFLDISRNSLKGTVFGIGNLSKLSYLDMNYNNLNLNLDLNISWRPPSQLQVFNVHSCVINTVFPHWLRNQTRIESLDLSYTGVSGELPGWLWNLSYLEDLYLPGNQLTGSLPQHRVWDKCELQALQRLNLHDNQLTGTIPKWLCLLEYVEVISLSSNRLSGTIFDGNNASSLLNIGNSLWALDLSDNMLSGEIQFGKVPSNTRLEILSLRGNRFNGSISSQLCDFRSLLVLDLAVNQFTGHIPPCLGSIQFDNPPIIFKDPNLQIEEIVKGIVEQSTGSYWFQTIIDLSCNYLVGTIPEELTNISALFALNLSYNQLEGHIPEKIGKLEVLESLDLSNNHLSGTIPKSLSSISWLSKLNLSNNNLHGPIPTSSQLQTLDDPSIYAGNSGLYGFPLPNDSTKPDPPPTPTIVNPTAGKVDDVEKKDKYEKLWFILAVMSGVATGFWGVVGTSVIKRHWRQAYFRYVEHLGDRIYVAIKVRVNRFKRRFNENF